MDVFLVSIIGLVFGSFGNVCIYRIPKELSVFSPRHSFCPACLFAIRWYDNIPLVSYIFLKGRCRNCSAVIPWRYPIVEFIVSLVFVIVYLKIGLSVMLPFWWLFAWTMVVSSAIDIELRIIPDIFTVGLCVVGVAISPFNKILNPSGAEIFEARRIFFSVFGGVLGLLLGLTVGFLGEKIFKKESFGGADIKLLAAFGAWLGAGGAFWSLFAASFVGSVISVALILARKISLRDYVPFGPYLAIGALIVLIFLSP